MGELGNVSHVVTWVTLGVVSVEINLTSFQMPARTKTTQVLLRAFPSSLDVKPQLYKQQKAESWPNANGFRYSFLACCLELRLKFLASDVLSTSFALLKTLHFKPEIPEIEIRKYSP